jgi:hypothetical protein
MQGYTSNVGSSTTSSNVMFDSNDYGSVQIHSLAFSANSKPYNLTYGEWTARWWQWGYSIPKNINPAYDNTGENCAQKQNGQVWFLAGTFGHSVSRACTIPKGKSILLPILNSECSFAEFPKLKTLSELRICAKTIQDHVTTLYASLDGVPIPHLQQYRIQSPPFNFTLPQNNILGMRPNTTTEAIADGNWLFLKPLSPGVHKLIFKGGVKHRTRIEANSNNHTGGSFALGWDFQTTYDLTISNVTNGDYSHHSYPNNKGV